MLDPFGWTAERREERRLIAEYEAMLDALLPLLSDATRGPILALARIPEAIRGFGPVKARAIAEAARRRTELMAELGRILHPDSPPAGHYAEAAE